MANMLLWILQWAVGKSLEWIGNILFRDARDYYNSLWEAVARG